MTWYSCARVFAMRLAIYVALGCEFPEPPPELFVGGQCIRHQRRRELARFREADCTKKSRSVKSRSVSWRLGKCLLRRAAWAGDPDRFGESMF
jgi:hypothetical protein